MNLLGKLKKFLRNFSLSGKPKRKRKTAKKKKKAAPRKGKKTAPKAKPRAAKKRAASQKAPPAKTSKKPAASAKPKKNGPKKTAARKTTAKPAKAVPPRPGLVEIGQVTHYFPKVKAAVIKLQKTLSVGDTVQITDDISLVKQKVTSLQINRIPIDEGRPGEEVGLLVKEDVAPGHRVYKMKGK